MSCPACDCSEMTQLETLALGITVGRSVEVLHDATELMCREHRSAYTLAMLRACLKLEQIVEAEVQP